MKASRSKTQYMYVTVRMQRVELVRVHKFKLLASFFLRQSTRQVKKIDRRQVQAGWGG